MTILWYLKHGQRNIYPEPDDFSDPACFSAYQGMEYQHGNDVPTAWIKNLRYVRDWLLLGAGVTWIWDFGYFGEYEDE